MLKMRLDVYLSDNGFVDSRTDAKKFILEGAVTVDDKVVNKPSFTLNGDEKITVDKSSKKYVSRGGLKLEGALSAFEINVTGAVAIDVGASSGGFTDCLLQQGAKYVIAVDSGYGQIAEKLRTDNRVSVIENYNARYMEPEHFDAVPNLAVMDVSFISAKLIIPSVHKVLAPKSSFVCLIKPQFEVGRQWLGKNGIVKNEKIAKAAVHDVVEFASLCGFDLIGLIESPIKGGDGNTEYLAHFRKRT